MKKITYRPSKWDIVLAVAVGMYILASTQLDASAIGILIVILFLGLIVGLIESIKDACEPKEKFSIHSIWILSIIACTLIGSTQSVAISSNLAPTINILDFIRVLVPSLIVYASVWLITSRAGAVHHFVLPAMASICVMFVAQMF